MSATETRAYLLLAFEAWMGGGDLLASTATLARIAGTPEAAIKTLIADNPRLCHWGDDSLRLTRLSAKLEYVTQTRKVKASASGKGALKGNHQQGEDAMGFRSGLCR